MRWIEMRKRDAVATFSAVVLLAGFVGMVIIFTSRFGAFSGVVKLDNYLSLLTLYVGGAAGTALVIREKRVGACVLVGIMALLLTTATITAFTSTPCEFLPSHTVSELATSMVVAWNNVNVTPNQWLLCQTAYSWIVQNIRGDTDYNVHGVEEYFATPDETLKLGAGDCDDQAILLCALLEQFGVNAYAICIGTPTDHISVIIPQGNNLTILDPAQRYATGSWVAGGFEVQSRPAEPELEYYFSLPWMQGGRIEMAFNSRDAVCFKDNAALLKWINSFNPLPGTLPTPFHVVSHSLNESLVNAQRESARWNTLLASIPVPTVEVKSKNFAPLWFAFALLVIINCELLLGLTWKSRRGIRAWRYHAKMIKRMVWNLDDFAVFWLYARHETLRDATVTRLDDLNTRDVTENEWKQFLSTVGGGKR
jgi:hypothetical protein